MFGMRENIREAMKVEHEREREVPRGKLEELMRETDEARAGREEKEKEEKMAAGLRLMRRVMSGWVQGTLGGCLFGMRQRIWPKVRGVPLR